MTHELTHIKLLQKSKMLQLTFEKDRQFELTSEYLRVYSPSAEVRGHSESQAVLQHGKKNVNIVGIEPVGHYAVKLIFDDGHETGIYSFEYLYELSANYAENWQNYLERLAQGNLSRDE